MKTNGWLRQLFVLILGALVLLVVIRDPSLAKGPADKVTINGPGLKREIEITDAQALQALSTGQFEDFKSSIAAPTEVGPGYELVRYYTSGTNLIAFDHVSYHPNPAGGRGYVFYIGLVNGWSEYDGKWFRATMQGEQILQRILAENGVQLKMFLWQQRLCHWLSKIIRGMACKDSPLISSPSLICPVMSQRQTPHRRPR